MKWGMFMKRSLRRTVLLIGIAVLFLFAGCSNQNGEDVFEYGFESENEHDYGGNDVVLCAPKGLIYGENESLFLDLAYERIHEVEHKYNLSFVFSSRSVKDLKMDVAGGRYLCEFAISSTYTLYNEIRGYLLESIDDMGSVIDYTDSEKWGNRMMLASFVYDDHIYGVIPMYWPGTAYQQCDHFFFVNEDMVASIGQPDPREFVDNGQWNRAMLEDLVENRYTHTDAASEHVYALSTAPGHYFSIAIKTAGIDYVVKHPDGSYTSAFKEPGVDEKLKWASDFYWDNYKVNIIHGSDTFDTIAYLVNNRSVMILTHLSYGLRDCQYTVESFGILPFPLSDDLAGHEWISQHEAFGGSVFIPINARDRDSAAFLASELFEPLPGYETEELRLAYYDRYIFHDSRDTKVVFEALRNCRYLPFNDEGYMIPNALSEAEGKMSIAKVLESKEHLYGTYMETVYIPLARSLEALFGEN